MRGLRISINLAVGSLFPLSIRSTPETRSVLQHGGCCRGLCVIARVCQIGGCDRMRSLRPSSLMRLSTCSGPFGRDDVVFQYRLDRACAAATFGRAAKRGIDMSYPRTRCRARNRGSYLTVAEDVATTDDHGTCSWMPREPPQLCQSTASIVVPWRAALWRQAAQRSRHLREPDPEAGGSGATSGIPECLCLKCS